MPELPEVETTRRALAATLVKQSVLRLDIYQRRLRYPVSPELPRLLKGRILEDVQRRAKYLIMMFAHGKLLIHLGMSGSLRMIDKQQAPLPSLLKHDHLEMHFNRFILRYNDPRRFGCWLWEQADAKKSRLSDLGIEPFDKQFSIDAFVSIIENKTTPIKLLLMNQRYLVGVGNIYASEALWLAGILPFRAAKELAIDEARSLVKSIKNVLSDSLKAGGTSLRDYVTAEGNPGYFAVKLNVYGKDGKPCPRCLTTPIKRSILGQRSTFYCPGCQK